MTALIRLARLGSALTGLVALLYFGAQATRGQLDIKNACLCAGVLLLIWVIDGYLRRLGV